MISKTLVVQPDTLLSLCTVCNTDNNGGKIALAIIVFGLILLGIGNWAYKKYILNKKEFSQEK